MQQPSHPKKERTLILLKPDSVHRSLIGEIINRFERTGLKIIGLKMLVATSEQCWKHYNKDDAWFISKGQRTIDGRKDLGMPIEKEAIEYGKDIIRSLEKYITAGPIVAIVIEGNSSVNIVKKLVGGTEPASSPAGTIRGDYAVDSYSICDLDSRAARNLVHCTDNPKESDYEIPIWFNESELLNYRLAQDEMLYDINLDGILE